MNIQQFDYSTDLSPVILWQYDQATNLNALITAKQNWLDLNQQSFWEDWFNLVFNLTSNQFTDATKTVKELGLSVWSIILLAPLFSEAPAYDYTTIWGYNSAGVLPGAWANFTNGPFYYTDFLSLTQPEQEFLLLLRYYNCVTRCALTDFSTINFPVTGAQQWKLGTPGNVDDNPPAPIQYLNNFPIGINYYFSYLLTDLWGGPNLGPLIGYTGNIYCQDNLNMTITYVFTTDDFPPNLLNAITQLDLWPRPAGVDRIFP